MMRFLVRIIEGSAIHGAEGVALEECLNALALDGWRPHVLPNGLNRWTVIAVRQEGS